MLKLTAFTAFTAFTAVFAALLAAAPPAHARDAFEEVVAAERAFAEHSREHGLRAAFERFMVEDTVIYRPGPVSGRSFYAKAPEAEVTLDWAPERAGVAASGDLGFTTGPYTIRPKNDASKVLGAGHFLSLWQRNAQGGFDNVIDLGIRHAEQPLATEVARIGPRLPRLVAPLEPGRHAARLQLLLRADRTLNAQLAGAEGQAALNAVAASDALILRDGRLPAELSEAHLDATALPSMDLAAIRLSAFGDLGATSGWNGDPKAPKTYTRIWRWTPQGWRVVVDLFS